MEVREVQPQNAPEPIEWRPSGRKTDVRLVQCLKASIPIDMTPWSVTEARVVQPQNAKSLIDVTPCGMTIVARALHQANAPIPNDVRPSGRVREVREVQLAKA